MITVVVCWMFHECQALCSALSVPPACQRSSGGRERAKAICQMKVITVLSTWSQRTRSGGGGWGWGTPVVSYVTVHVLYSCIQAGNMASVYEALALVSNPSLD